MKCEVCGKNKAKGAFAIPMVPMSVLYCQECLDADAHPIDILAQYTAVYGGLDKMGNGWKEMVKNTLNHLDKTMDWFELTVELESLRIKIQAWERKTKQTFKP